MRPISLRLNAARSGFTLIELLVVISIISLLAAILFPVFSRVRENARRTSCASNLKQIGLGLTQYAQDYDEHFPGNSNGDTLESWAHNVQPYIKSGQVFMCPSNPQKKIVVAAATSENPEIRISYGANYIDDGSGPTVTTPRSLGAIGRGTGGTGPYIGYPGTSLAEFANPSQCIIVSEGLRMYLHQDVNEDSNEADADTTSIPGSCIISTGRTWSCMFAGHLGTSNFLFTDGHVKAMLPLKTLNPTPGATQPGNMWYRDGTGMTGTTATGRWMIAYNILSKAYGLQ